MVKWDRGQSVSQPTDWKSESGIDDEVGHIEVSEDEGRDRDWSLNQSGSGVGRSGLGVP